MFCVELQNISFCFSASKSSVNWVWSWVRGELVRSSCEFDSLRPRVCRVSIMLTAMFLLASPFRPTDTSRAQRLLSVSITCTLLPPPNSSDAVQSGPPPVSATGRSSWDYSHRRAVHAAVETSDKSFYSGIISKFSQLISSRIVCLSLI